MISNVCRFFLSGKIPLSGSSKPGMTSDLRTCFWLLCWGYCSPEGCSALAFFLSCNHAFSLAEMQPHSAQTQQLCCSSSVTQLCPLGSFFCSCVRTILILIRGCIKFSLGCCVYHPSLLARSTYLSVSQCLPPKSMKYSKTFTRLPHRQHSPKSI